MKEEAKANSFLPFGMGGRTCLGLNMAKAMMVVFLHRFITTYRFVQLSYMNCINCNFGYNKNNACDPKLIIMI